MTKWSSASLRILSDLIDADQITSDMSTNPTRQYSKGDDLSRNSSSKRKTNMWLLSSDNNVSSTDLSVHLTWISNFTLSKLEIINNYRDFCQIDLFCAYSSKNGQGGTVLTPELLGSLAELGISLTLSLYPPDEVLEPFVGMGP